jgi:C1A family cysteine protease
MSHPSVHAASAVLVHGKKHPFNVLITHLPEHQKEYLKLKHLDTLPASVDLRSKCPPIYDQGQLGSCTANALCAAVQFDDLALQGSRLLVYYNERKLEHDIPDDAGAQLGDGVLVLEKYGVCQEKTWPYDISKFAVQPPPIAYTEAARHKTLKAYHVQQNAQAMQTALASGKPFVVGISVYASFESQEVADTGVVPMPAPGEQCLGGHAVLVVGYDTTKKVWILRNSWGTGWGQAGYFTLPWAYLLDPALASDMWVIQSVQA